MGAGVQGKGSRGSGRVRRNKAKPMAEINVTPFVDVMLVLLVIFMVAAPLLTVGVPVELPETAAKPLPSPEETPLTVAVTSEGRVMLQKTETSLDTLVPKLRAIAEEREDKRIFLRADGANSYEAVMQVMGALSAGGFSQISLVTETGGPKLGG